MAAHSWDAGLQGLLATGAISGYALIGHDGGVLCAHGRLAEELWSGGADDGGGSPEAAARASEIFAAFHTNYSPTHLELCGQQAIVFRRSENSLYAVSKGKQLAVMANFLPSGILVTVSPRMPQAVVPQIEAICDSLRRP